MKEQVVLNPKEFNHLHNSLLEQFRKEIGGALPSNVRHTYGFALYESDHEVLQTQPNLKKNLESHPRVREYLDRLKTPLSVETRYSLYQNFINQKKEVGSRPAKIKLDARLLQTFLYYLGFETLGAFKSALEKEYPPVEYKMLFYSNVHNKVVDCNLWIDYASDPIEVTMRDFHMDVKGPLFKGLGIKKGYHFFINLECRERGAEEFHLICSVGSVTNPEQWEVMPASFMGISTHGIPTCGEAVILKKNNNLSNSEEGVKRLRGMLMLKRNRFNIKGSEIRTLNGLTAGGSPVSDWDCIVGTYRVLGFDKMGVWHQARMFIDPDTYEGVYETNIFGENSILRKLRVEVNVTNIIGKIVCLTTKSYSNRGRDIVSYVMLDFGALQHEEQAMMGSFVTVSRHTGRTVGGEIVVIKTKNEVPIKILEEHEKQELIARFAEARHLDELCEEVKRRHAPQ